VSVDGCVVAWCACASFCVRACAYLCALYVFSPSNQFVYACLCVSVCVRVCVRVCLCVRCALCSLRVSACVCALCV